MPSYVIYQGPSLINGDPIVAVAVVKSSNRKTGNMVQTYILHAEIDPRDASRTGADMAICGTCPHRGIADPDKPSGLAKGRTCYVNIGQGPLGVFKAYRKGSYPVASGHAAIAEIGKGRMVRIGTYGDGAAVPSYIWDSLLSEASGHTAYTHQSGMMPVDVSRFMVSADSEKAARAAWAEGARTFRVIGDVAAVVKGAEILCPASEEMGKRTTCAACGLCAGASVRGKSIAIVAHGTAKNAAKALVS